MPSLMSDQRKLYCITPATLIGVPARRVGLNLELQAAALAEGWRSGWPLTGSAETTFPASSISSLTSTMPCTLATRASSDSFGRGKEMAYPFTTPPFTVRVFGACSLASDLGAFANLNSIHCSLASWSASGATGSKITCFAVSST